MNDGYHCILSFCIIQGCQKCNEASICFDCQDNEAIIVDGQCLCPENKMSDDDDTAKNVAFLDVLNVQLCRSVPNVKMLQPQSKRAHAYAQMEILWILMVIVKTVICKVVNAKTDLCPT